MNKKNLFLKVARRLFRGQLKNENELVQEKASKKELRQQLQKRIVAIELTNHCNLKCGHCPQGRVKVPQGFMDENTFRQSLSHCSGYLGLNWRGEPLLHPDLVRYIEIAKVTNPSLKLGLHTNGLLLTEDLFGRMVGAGLEWLRVSLHSEQSCIAFRKVREWNANRKEPIYVAADVDTTDEYLLAILNGLTPDVLNQEDIANWGGFLTNYRKVHEDVEAYARDCPLVTYNGFILAWNGVVNACCWDFEMRHSLGHLRGFSRIEHTPPYELCASCIWIRHSDKQPL